MGFLSDIWDGVGNGIGTVVGLATGQPMAGQAVNFVGDEIWGQDAPIEQSGPRLPNVDDYSNGYGNAPNAPENFDDFSTSFGPSPAPSSAVSLKDILGGMKDFGSAAAPFAPYLASALGYSGQQDVNRQNRELAESANQFSAGQAAITRDFNAAEAAKNRDWGSSQADKAMSFSERMSNSQWQRTVADMMAAGINPMLAVMKGTNSSPSGVAGSGGAASAGGLASAHVAQVGNSMSQALSSGAGAANLVAGLDKMDAETASARAMEKQIRSTTDRISGMTPGEIEKVGWEVKHLIEDVKRIAGYGPRGSAEVAKLENEIIEIVARTPVHSAERDRLILSTLNASFETNRLRNQSDAASGDDFWAREFAPRLNALQRALNSAGSAANTLRR